MLQIHLELKLLVLPIGILCINSTHTLHCCRVVLLCKGTLQDQSPRKHALEVN